ncbi:hypothetical protein ACFL5H_03730 [Candidatus Latescibacterota bacterium]
MKKIIILSLIFITITSLLIISCGDDNSTGPTSDASYTTATITHMGFDFSAAKNDTSNWGENNDGETIAWSPIGESTQDGIWFRTGIYPNRTQSLGKVNINEITSIDTLATAWDTQPPPLSKNDIVIAQCLDGFVKFQVTADVDTSSANSFWAIQVKYLYSPTPSF